MADHDDDWVLFRLQRLDPGRFEALAFALLKAEGHTDIRHLGAAGGDDGIDVLSTDPGGRRGVTQCKRCRSYGPTAAVREIEKVIDAELDPPPSWYKLAATCNVSADTEKALRARAEKASFTMELVSTWDATGLVSLLRDDHPELRHHFIGPLAPEELPFWNVPNRTEFFVGREDVLEQVEARMEAAGSAALTQAITGLGGIGKTQTAIAYCLRQRSRYDDGVFWVDGSSRDALIASYAQLAVGLGLVAREVPVDEAAAAFLRYLGSASRWLVVVDNADEPDEVRQHMPPNTGQGHVLITTRAQQPDLGRGEPFAVDVLPEAEAVDFLLSRSNRGKEEQDQAAVLATALGYLPLALEQAGAYLRRHRRRSISDYLADFSQRRLELIERGGTAHGTYDGTYDATIATTWEISFDRVSELSPAAGEVLDACAFLAPTGIPLEIFTATGGHLGPALGKFAEDDGLAYRVDEELIDPVTRYSLAQLDEETNTLSIHRLVQSVIRLRLRCNGRWENVFAKVHQALESIFPADPEDVISWPPSARLFPHVQVLADLWQRHTEPLPWNPTDLWQRAYVYAWAAGRISEARKLVEAALEVRRRELGEEHPDTLISLNDLAETLRVLGDARGARDLHEAALEMRRRELGEAHPATLVSMNNLALALYALGDAQRARDLHEAELEVSRRELGEAHPSTLGSMNNLAETLRVLGDAQGARDLHEAVLEMRRRVLGEAHPDTLASMNNLAGTLDALGDTQGARDLHEAALELYRRELGEAHPATLVSMNNLASALYALGDAHGARYLLETGLEGRRRVLGEAHPSTLASMNDLAVTLTTLGDTQGARDLHEAALELYRRELGEAHPNTLRSMHNLLCAQTKLGEVNQSLVEELLAGVARLPEKTPVRVAAEKRWG